MDYKLLFEKTPPTRLFFLAAIPGAIGMLAAALYQLIDGAFVGQLLGADAFAALNLAMPLVIINFSLADLIGVGSAVPIAIKLGEKDETAASNIFTSACILIVTAGVLSGAALYLFAPDLLRLMGADGALASMAVQYLRVYAVCAPFTTMIFAVDNYLRICGKIRYSMTVNILMSVTSVIFEFFFLFICKFGIWGAALGTCLGMILCVAIAFRPFVRGNLQLRFSKPRLDRELFVTIISNGCPGFLNNIAGRVTSIMMNICLLRLGGTMAVSAYGVLMYADGLVQPVLYGLCDSLQPAVGYNWGAKNYGRVKAIEKRCFAVSGALSLFMAAVMLFDPAPLVGIFVKAEETALFSMSVHALSLFAFAYVIRWIPFAAQSYMSAVGKPGYATAISVSAAFVFPVIFIVSLGGMGLDGLWINYPLTSVMTTILSAVILFRFHKHLPHGTASLRG